MKKTPAQTIRLFLPTFDAVPGGVTGGVNVDATPIGNHFAFHRSIAYAGPFAISHRPTGYACGYVKSLREAVLIATRLESIPGIDWSDRRFAYYQRAFKKHGDEIRAVYGKGGRK